MSKGVKMLAENGSLAGLRTEDGSNLEVKLEAVREAANKHGILMVTILVGEQLGPEDFTVLGNYAQEDLPGIVETIHNAIQLAISRKNAIDVDYSGQLRTEAQA